MFREPWFRIVEVREGGRRSMADIVKEVCDRHGVTVDQVRGRITKHSGPVTQAKKEAVIAVRKERPDITSGQVAIFFRCESSVIRHRWRMADA